MARRLQVGFHLNEQGGLFRSGKTRWLVGHLMEALKDDDARVVVVSMDFGDAYEERALEMRGFDIERYRNRPTIVALGGRHGVGIGGWEGALRGISANAWFIDGLLDLPRDIMQRCILPVMNEDGPSWTITCDKPTEKRKVDMITALEARHGFEVERVELEDFPSVQALYAARRSGGM